MFGSWWNRYSFSFSNGTLLRCYMPEFWALYTWGFQPLFSTDHPKHKWPSYRGPETEIPVCHWKKPLQSLVVRGIIRMSGHLQTSGMFWQTRFYWPRFEWQWFSILWNKSIFSGGPTAYRQTYFWRLPCVLCSNDLVRNMQKEPLPWKSPKCESSS